VALLVELLRQAELGELSLNEKVKVPRKKVVGGAGVLQFMRPGPLLTLYDLAALMITVSDNTASNIMIDRVGMRRINLMLKGAGLKNTRLRRRFMVSPNARTFKNVTTPREMMQLFTLLYRGELLSPPYTEKALFLLSNQQFIEKIPRYPPEDLPVCHKTGEISCACHDAGIVFHPRRPYVICVFIKDCSNHAAADERIARISKAVYDHFSAKRKKGIRPQVTKEVGYSKFRERTSKTKRT